MSTWNGARPIRAQTYFTRVTAPLHFLRERKKCPRRRVLFCRMMDLPSPGAITFFTRESPCSLVHNFTKKIQPHGKIRAPNQRASTLLNFTFYRFQRRKPSGCATYRWHTDTGQFAQVFCRNIWSCELHGNICPVHRVACQHSAAGVFFSRNPYAHFKPILRRQPLNHPAHLSVANNCQSPSHSSFAKSFFTISS